MLFNKLFKKTPYEDSESDYTLCEDPRQSVVLATPVPQPASVKSHKPHGGSTHSVIDAGLMITGNLQSEGEVLVKGQIQGDIRCAHLIVAQDATIEGNISAEEIVVRGNVKGVIRANRVQLMGTSYVESEILHKSLAVEEGATFDGPSCRREDPMKPEAEPKQLQVIAAEMMTVEEANGTLAAESSAPVAA